MITLILLLFLQMVLSVHLVERPEKVNLAFDSVGSQDSKADGNKAPIILLHAMASEKESWKRVMRPIAEETKRKVYAYDARNHGDSGWSDDMDYEIMLEDLLQFVDGLQAQRVILIGHSMGGKVAMFFALKWPEKVEKLIIEDISLKPEAREIREKATSYVRLLEQALEKIPEEIQDLSEANKFVAEYLRHAVSEGGEETKSKESSDGSDLILLPLVRQANGKFRWKPNLKAIEEAFFKKPHSLTYAQGVYSNPTLILWGTKSPYKVTSDRDFILEHFPGARFRAVEGAGHEIHAYYEDVFVQEVVHFINEAK